MSAGRPSAWAAPCLTLTCVYCLFAVGKGIGWPSSSAGRGQTPHSPPPPRTPVSKQQFVTFSEAERLAMVTRVRSMFYHAYNSYMQHAFPHDELKPLSKSFTDSLAELGNLQLEHLSGTYRGTALSLVDSLSTLAVLGDASEFTAGIGLLERHLSFNQDVRVNVFETNIRLLGGLLSAHVLASDSRMALMPTYNGSLLVLAQDLGDRLLPAFLESPTGLPFAWVNLRHGVREGETHETNTAACGSLILEMGMLSELTGNPQYASVARRAIRQLWSMRSELNLLGTTLNMSDATWVSTSGGIGASADSFYEYLLKGYLAFGDVELYNIFSEAYSAVMQNYRSINHWYQESDIHSGQPTHRQFTSLQAFWPGLQVLIGDIELAKATYAQFFSVWHKYGLLPERFQWDRMTIHSTERYYPLRPELIESTYHLFASTHDPKYRIAGRYMFNSLEKHTTVNGGHASIRSVTTMEKEDHMHSFFLAETCKYLYLLYNDSFLQNGNYLFTTEGHLFPLTAASTAGVDAHGEMWDGSPVFDPDWGSPGGVNALEAMVCPDPDPSKALVESVCHLHDLRADHVCQNDLDCGMASDTCHWRTCTRHGFCTSR